MFVYILDAFIKETCIYRKLKMQNICNSFLKVCPELLLEQYNIFMLFGASFMLLWAPLLHLKQNNASTLRIELGHCAFIVQLRGRATLFMEYDKTE